MKITVVSFDNWGFNRYLVEELCEQGHEAKAIDFSKSNFKYKSIVHRIQNFLSKTFLKRDLKRVFYGNFIENELQKQAKQDVVLYIKADFIAPECIPNLKKYAEKNIAFFNDSSERCPKIKRVCHLFDTSFSFEKIDCENLNMKFKTNFMYAKEQEFSTEKTFTYKMFNITSWDKRSYIVNAIAQILSEHKQLFLFYIFDKKKQKPADFHEEIQFISTKIPLEDVNSYLDESEIMLDVNRDKQQGLTFRVMESLSKNKKLITTNTDIRSYDFFSDTNILVLDTENIHIPTEFLQQKYQPISPEILFPYTRKGWIQTLLKSIE